MIANPVPPNLTLERVRRRLDIPSPYFLERDYPAEVLKSFDVGDSEQLDRAVVPLYDDRGDICIGYTFRSFDPRCDGCRKHHGPGVPCHQGESKWGIMRGFPKRSFLYNIAAARRTDVAFIFLVEGPPDVWRLAEAGFVGVALLGSDATDEQLKMLATLGKEVWVAFDNDKPGRDGRERFEAKLLATPHEFSTVTFAAPAPYKDFGDTPAATLRRAIEARVEESAARADRRVRTR